MSRRRLRQHVRRACAVIAAATVFFGARLVAQTRFVDDAGRTVELPVRPARVFAAGAPADVILYTLVPEMLIGRNRLPQKEALELYPPQFRNPVPVTRLPDRNDASGDADLLKIAPDVYVDYGSLHQDYVLTVEAVQQRTRIPAIILDGRMERIPATYRRLGAALGVTDRGERLASSAERLLAKYRGALSEEGAPARVYLACSPDALIPCLADETAGEQLAILGGVNVAGDLAASPQRPLTIDEIAAMNPDAIVLTTRGAAARLRADSAWRGVAAVAAGRVYEFPALPDSWGPRPPSVNRLAGLMWMAYVARNRAFDDELRDDLRSFFSTFYHVQPTAAQLEGLLSRR